MSYGPPQWIRTKGPTVFRWDRYSRRRVKCDVIIGHLGDIAREGQTARLWWAGKSESAGQRARLLVGGLFYLVLLVILARASWTVDAPTFSVHVGFSLGTKTLGAALVGALTLCLGCCICTLGSVLKTLVVPWISHCHKTPPVSSTWLWTWCAWRMWHRSDFSVHRSW